ncbi:MBOAT-domain-containing protein [Exidia glandulosa HHB12029]|uniref:MBOAT-domain-containing protein n=1 Tax=Exidia glandulosa HHB12029 TaxID=1314781 RepID=A0A165H0E8_EXIGL|nr:MBOAT-domain-containing protein [Exidia glandulosa HHB12029]
MDPIDVELAINKSTTLTPDMQPSPSRPQGILRLTVDVPHSTRPRDVALPPSRWRNPEFLAYYVLVLIALFPAISAVTRLSEREPNLLYSTACAKARDVQPNIPISLNIRDDYLQAGYQVVESYVDMSALLLTDTMQDNSDHQYRTFRNNVPALTALAGAFFVAKAVYTRLSADKDRIRFLVLFIAAMQLGLHGSSAVKVFLILLGNYIVGRSLHTTRALPAATWAFNLAILFANELNDGYRFAALHPSLAPLDALKGAYPRWHVTFNFTMLRLISFNMDWYWAAHRVGLLHTGAELDEKQRPPTFHELAAYESFADYVAYILYPPCYIAGPIMTFNEFLWQMKRPVRIAPRDVASYALRFVISLLTMEVILHYMYVVAIKDARAWAGDTPAQLCMPGFWNLIVVWLKRFFRLWALADGVEPPENMVPCMANNYSPLAFWRAWHRSPNLWATRYVYISVGGSQRRVLATTLVFTFVALWHDLSFASRLGMAQQSLRPAGDIAILLVPASKLRAHAVVLSIAHMHARQYDDHWWYRHLWAAGTVGNILMMMDANMVGFVLGANGIKYLLFATDGEGGWYASPP